MTNWFTGLTIRSRITIGALGIALVFSAVAGVALRATIASIIRANTVQLLHNDQAPFEAAIHRDGSDPDIRIAEGQLIALYKPDGTLVTSNLPHGLATQLGSLVTHPYTAGPVKAGSASYLVSTERIQGSTGDWRVVAARNVAQGNQLIDQIGWILFVGAVILFLSFGLASWILSGVALRPVTRMRREADQLGDDLSGGSLAVGPARDELAALAATLNAFIDRNRRSVARERQMVSDASHELRTPLAVLGAQLDEVGHAVPAGTDQRHMVENARATVDRLAHLATNLLELSKLDFDGERASSRWGELEGEFLASIDRVRIIAESSGVTVEYRVDGDATVLRCAVSATGFGRLSDNLLTNAIRASSDGGTVTGALSSDGASLTLSVIDEGTGVSEDFIPVAFDRFTRSDEARGDVTGGSGLGLAIVAAIVRQAGGTVAMANRHPGVEVTVRLPAAAQATS